MLSVRNEDTAMSKYMKPTFSELFSLNGSFFFESHFTANSVAQIFELEKELIFQ